MVDAAVIALVGTNEAGKSSIIEGLSMLNNDAPFADGDLTRDQALEAEHAVIQARFALDAADHVAISDFDPRGTTRWWVVTKQRDGELLRTVEPPLPDPADDAIDHARIALRTMDDVVPDTSSVAAELGAQLDDLIDADRPLSQASRASFLTRLESATREHHGEPVVNAAHAVQAAVEAWTNEAVNDGVAAALWNRTPDFVLFDQDCRELRSEYELEQWAVDPPPALKSLAALARLDLRALLTDIKAARHERVSEHAEKANRLLAQAIEASWSQSPVAIRIRVDGTILRIFAVSADRYSVVAERSDGLRAFIALVAFLANSGAMRPPILLVDEIETHLHYDAQADVIRMLSDQTASGQTVYSTHSVGALPDDLGLSVRVVQPSAHDRSTISNAFWSDGAGINPLLVGMGAATIAAALTHRRAVLTEGGADVILLPVLLREATGRRTLGYQVLPGLAELSVARLAELSEESAHVAFLVDGDDGGRAIARDLKRAGVSETSVITLGGAHDGLVLEDLVDPSVYLDAVAEELRRSHGARDVSQLTLPRKGRPTAVAAWCASRGIQPPNKRPVAARIAERARGSSVVDPGAASLLKQLDQDLATVLQFPK